MKESFRMESNVKAEEEEGVMKTVVKVIRWICVAVVVFYLIVLITAWI